MLDDLTLRKAVEFAVKTEEAGAIFYNKLARRFENNTALCAIFSEFAAQEEHHRAQFEGLPAKVPQEPALKSQKERLAVLRAMSMSEFFLGEAGLFKKLDEIKTPVDALQRAFRLEKDTLSYYLQMKELLGESDLLNAIIRAEQRHVLDLMDRLIIEGDPSILESEGM